MLVRGLGGVVRDGSCTCAPPTTTDRAEVRMPNEDVVGLQVTVQNPACVVQVVERALLR